MSVAPTGETRVNTTAAGTQTDSSVARLPDGGWVVTWQSYTSRYEIFQQRYAATGAKVGSETLVTTSLASTQWHPSVTALSDGGWVVTWDSYDQDGSLRGVYQQRYAASGAEFGGEIQVNTFTDNSQEHPAVTALKDGGWVVTWESINQDGSLSGIYQQRYTATGGKAGSEVLVNTTTAGGQYGASVTALADGGWVVTWTSNGDIYQQRYASNGARIGGETQVNTFLVGNQYEPSVTALSDGGWVVTWTSDGQDGSVRGIYQQQYAANGDKVGGETLVNTGTNDNQQEPSVSALADGGWLVTWTSWNQGAPGQDLYQQRYTASGDKVGSETLVNTTTAGGQYKASVTALADGGWVVTWTSNGQNGVDIYQQRYSANGQPVLSPTTPTGLSLAAGQPVKEGTASLTPAGQLVVSAIDQTQGYTFTLLDDAEGRFALNSSGALTVQDGIRLDYEQARSHWIKVRVQDKFTQATLDQWIEVAVADVNNENLTATSLADVLKGGQYADIFVGQGGNDAIQGGSGNDTIYGGVDNDRIWGGAGKDTLKGEAGKDIFVFDTRPNKSTNRDKIVDFKVKDDTFWLDNAIFTKLGKKGTEALPAKLNRSYFALETAKDKNDYIVYSKTKGVLYYDADGSGTKSKAVEIATLSKNLKMTYHDFFVI